MRKISKSDQGPEYEAAEKAAWERETPESKHFTVGSFVAMAGKRGEVLAIITCKCPRGEKALRIKWDDGSMGTVQPFALNPHPINH